MNQLVKTIDTLVTEAAGAYQKALISHQWAMVPDTQLIAAKRQLSKSDFSMKVAAQNPEATKGAIVTAAILGIDLTEGKRQGWLIPRKVGNAHEIVIQVGYKGVEAIHQRLGVIDRLVIRVVRKSDSFEWSGDDAEKPSHQADWFASDEARGPIVGAYAVTYFPGGGTQTVVTSIDDIFSKHRDVSDSWKSYQDRLKKGENAFPPPWATHEKAMVEKTMAYIASKQWPANIRDDEVTAAITSKLNEIETQDYQTIQQQYTQEQKDAFDSYVSDKNGLGLYLFRLYVGDDIYTDLYNSAPRGEKMRVKDACRALESEGIAVLAAIKQAIDNNDQMDAWQYLDDQTDVVFKLLDRTLTQEQAHTLNEMRKDL